MPKLGILASHPIQYHAPLYRALAAECDLQVYFCHRQSPQGQADAGFGVAFDWDINLFDGYSHQFLENRARTADVNSFFGCDTPEIRRIIAKQKFDAFLVNGWYLKSFWQAIFACRLKGTPVLVRGDSQLLTPRSRFKHAVKTLVYPLLLRQFAACLFVGKRNRDYLVHYGVPPAKLFFSPHCVDNSFFRDRAAAADTAAFRASLGIGEDWAAVLFVGKLIDKKRPTDIVRAVALLRDQGRRDACCVYAGSGPLANEVEALGRELNIPVRILGFCNQTALPEIYAGCDVMVLPSDGGETWGLVVNESLACGTPVVVSDAVGCGPDLVEESLTGAIFPTGNILAMADAIDRALAIGRDSLSIQEKSDAYSVQAAAAGILGAVTAVSTKGWSDT